LPKLHGSILTNLNQINHGKGDRNELEELCSGNL